MCNPRPSGRFFPASSYLSVPPILEIICRRHPNPDFPFFFDSFPADMQAVASNGRGGRCGGQIVDKRDTIHFFQPVFRDLYVQEPRDGQGDIDGRWLSLAETAVESPARLSLSTLSFPCPIAHFHGFVPSCHREPCDRWSNT